MPFTRAPSCATAPLGFLNKLKNHAKTNVMLTLPSVLSQEIGRVPATGFCAPHWGTEKTRRSAVDLLCSPNAHTRKRGTTRILLLCSRSAHAGRGKTKAIGLLCSLNAHACRSEETPQASLEGSFIGAVLAWAKRTSPGDRLRSNRWVGRVKKERRVGRVKNVRARLRPSRANP